MIYWPAAILRPTSVTFWLDMQSSSGGRAVTGTERIIQRDPFWKAKLTIPVVGSAKITMARALFARLDGRATPLIMPVYDCGRGPGAGAATGYRYANAVSPHSDSTGFSDGTFYAETRIVASASSAAAVRAVTLPVNMTLGDPRRIVAGQYLSIANRLHIIREIAVTGAATATLTIRPPLREAVAAGQRIEFDRPCGTFRLSSDDQSALTLEMLRFSSLSLELEEYL